MKSLIIAFIVTVIAVGSSVAQELTAKEQEIVKAVVERHKQNTECDTIDTDTPDYELIRFKTKTEFRSDTVVVLVACSYHAYQVSWVAYSTYDDGAEPEVSILSFPTTNDGKEWTASKFLMTPDWDTKSKTLNTFYKGRGLADCGAYQSYRWNDYSFYLFSSNYQICCFGKEAFEEIPACKKVKDIYPLPDDKWPLVFQFKGTK